MLTIQTKIHWRRNDPDPQIRDPNELQMEPHLQGDVPQAIEPYQHEDVPRAVGQYLRGDIPRVVGAPDQLRHPPQQSLQPRPEHWPSSERKAKVELQSVGGQPLNIQPADVEKVRIQLDSLSIGSASGRHPTPPRSHPTPPRSDSTPSGVSGATTKQMCLLPGVPAQVPKRAVMPAEVLGVRRSSRQTRPADKNRDYQRTLDEEQS
ncbi:hypothetical protein SERLADRAFT_443266 [Serpula lacrymans var. lacrymans S7.9]|uniref:Uncharacterized protein n=1 Tax=Serpula lacrymans var. lacrymans (strain S7.9) TaxID=578457 RepID=F8PC24_SERL9|nr:uncharacterized protein SERLADRAFT_443266 [Serpula lacrymans var. lacrymans S7.9]EGO19224.1 hypothetical protein SERLADRAFT_443266 [Serpula lacrymans var. lacrymans S7.9]